MSSTVVRPDRTAQAQDPFADDNAIEEHKALPPPPAPPFHIFTQRKKWGLLGIIGVAGLFSGLSSNIYFPSLHAISDDLNVSRSAVALTITSYLIIQGVSPLFWGPLSDTLGRRPVYITSFAVYIIANIVLSVTPNFATLLVFRALQSAGSASTVSIGNGVIQDIATPLERGMFTGCYTSIRNGSIAIGPILGGVLAHFWGFRSPFVFLAIISSMVLALVVVYLPETLRDIAGNGTTRLRGIYKPLISRVQREPPGMEDAKEGAAGTRKVEAMTFLAPLQMFREKDVLCILLYGGAVYTVWSMIVASTTSLFKDRFHLTELKLGVLFLPNGVGTIFGSWLAGRLMTRDFVHFEKQYLAQHPHAPAPSTTHTALARGFALERARLRQTPWIVGLFTAATALYGFTVAPAPAGSPAPAAAWLAVPLALHFVIAAAHNALFAITTTLVSDLCPGCGAASTAVTNLVRCSMAAAGVAAVHPLLARLGPAATFLLLAGGLVVLSALLAAERCWGMAWRTERERRRDEASGAGGLGGWPT